jgi:signal transduction histidine kinase
LRFDDSLETVLAAEVSTPFGMQSAWRQLVDLIGRRRVPPSPAALARLRAIRAQVPPPVRAASARALAYANPPAALVELFATDELPIAAPVLRVAQLRPDEWTAILPQMSAATRSVLRHRRDLHAEVQRALESFGPSDFILPGAVDDGEARPALSLAPDVIAQPVTSETESVEIAASDEPVTPAALESAAVSSADQVEEPVVAEPAQEIDWTEVIAPALAEMDRPAEAEAAPEPALVATNETPAPAEPEAEPIAPVQVSETPFVSLASVAMGLPVVAEALRRAEQDAEQAQPADQEAAAHEAPHEDVRADATPLAAEAGAETMPQAGDSPTQTGSSFQIAELVARIDAYQKRRDDGVPVPSAAPAPGSAFRFSTDEQGVIRWVAGVERGPLLGLSLAYAVGNGAASVDGGVTGAFRGRAAISDARLLVSGDSDAGGQWRISAAPAFDERTGRFDGYRGTARRPRSDEGAEPATPARDPGADALRQLVHELRTPTNAIAGFAEMIDREMLGPVSALYRRRAQDIRAHAADLIAAIEDLDFAARLESHALDLRNDAVEVAPLLARIVEDLNPLLTLRGAAIVPAPVAPDLAVSADTRAAERLAGRLLAALAAAAGHGERLTLSAERETPETVVIAIDRPAALSDREEQALFAADAEAEAGEQGAPLLGTGFALRLARNLATELGGALAIERDRLTLRLPAAFSSQVGQASSN